MADVNATTAAINDPLPAFLSVWEADTSTPTVHVFDKTKPKPKVPIPAPGPYQKVTLHNFKFLGQPFVTAQYFGLDSQGNNVASFSGGGVCQEFKDRLVLAQQQIYRVYAVQQAAKGVAPTESGFAAWCGVKAPHGGWQFRGGNHRFGSALDIDATFNPYIATRTGGTFGGELPSNDPKTEPLTPADIAELNNVRKNATQAYKNALSFMFGDPISIPGVPFDETTFFGSPQPGETSERAYQRMAITSEAIAWYLSTGFVSDPKQRIPMANDLFPRDPVDFKEQMRLHIDFKLGRTNPALRNELNDPAKLSNRLNQMVADHDAIRKTMINGTWKVLNSQIVFDSSRDPTFGFLSLRKEIVVGIRDQSLRWGAVDFGAGQNGDVMHFDLSQPPAMTVDPNASAILYVSKIPK